MSERWPCGHERAAGTTRCWVPGCDPSPGITRHEKGMSALGQVPKLLTSSAGFLVIVVGVIVGMVSPGFAVAAVVLVAILAYAFGRTT